MEQIYDVLDFDYIFQCLQDKGYSPRGSMTMREPYITFVYKGEDYRIICWGCIACAIYKTLPIKETDISAAKDIISKIMLDSATVRVMLRDDRDDIYFPMDEKLIFSITWYPTCDKTFADELDYYLTDLKDAISHRIFNGRLRRRYTDYIVDKLEEDEVFVFGSNLDGYQAYLAFKFGAVKGQGTGLQGQSYTIPTMQGGVETIKPYVDEFISFAKEHTELYFYVTSGIAGFADADIAPLFKEARNLVNVALPETFLKYYR